MKRGIVRKLLPFLKPYQFRFLGALSQVLLIAGFELLKPWPMQVVIDNVLGGKPVGFALFRGLPTSTLLAGPPPASVE